MEGASYHRGGGGGGGCFRRCVPHLSSSSSTSSSSSSSCYWWWCRVVVVALYWSFTWSWGDAVTAENNEGRISTGPFEGVERIRVVSCSSGTADTSLSTVKLFDLRNNTSLVSISLRSKRCYASTVFSSCDFDEGQHKVTLRAIINDLEAGEVRVYGCEVIKVTDTAVAAFTYVNVSFTASSSTSSSTTTTTTSNPQKTENKTNDDDDDENNDSPPVGIIAAGIMGGLLLISTIINVVVIVVRRRRDAVKQDNVTKTSVVAFRPARAHPSSADADPRVDLFVNPYENQAAASCAPHDVNAVHVNEGTRHGASTAAFPLSRPSTADDTGHYDGLYSTVDSTDHDVGLYSTFGGDSTASAPDPARGERMLCSCQ